jgi:DNA-binding FadR family transcriptional regulator
VSRGTIVYPVDNKLMRESLDLLLRDKKISLRELAEYREEVEGLVAAKATKKAKKDDLRQLNIFLKSIKNHLNPSEFNWDKIVTEDNKFHPKSWKILRNGSNYTLGSELVECVNSF